ncbi:DUF924 family protein [Aliikangiella sp. IMCC44653]
MALPDSTSAAKSGIKISYKQVLEFWFEQSEPKQWFRKDPDFDKKITEKFLSTYWQATRCELFEWRNSAPGRLAEIILLDQFSRNMFRDQPQAFKFDSLAVTLAQEAIHCGDDLQLPTNQRKFIYMPLMHSESEAVHQLALKVFAQPGLQDNYEYELKHYKIIQQFGRYPHRNAILGRESSEEELEFLQTPGSSF